METHYFALRDGKIVYVPDVPIIIPSVEIVGNLIKNKSRYKRDQQYKQALQSAIANGKVVENQWEVMRHIFRTNEKAQYLLESTLYPLQCRVEKDIRFLGEAPEDRQTVARVTFDEQPKDDHTFKCDCHYPCDNYPHCGGHKITFDEQPEKKPCANCKETIDPCACMRNICHVCGDPVGNITFTVCDKCWDLKHPEPEAAGQEQDLPEWVADKIKDKKQILELQEQTASLQKQLRDAEARYDNAIERNIDKREEITLLQKQLEEQREEIERLRGALDEIIYPIKYMQKRAKDQGAELNGYMAVQLSESPSHLKEIARKALQSPPGESEKENNK